MENLEDKIINNRKGGKLNFHTEKQYIELIALSILPRLRDMKFHGAD